VQFFREVEVRKEWQLPNLGRVKIGFTQGKYASVLHSQQSLKDDVKGGGAITPPSCPKKNAKDNGFCSNLTEPGYYREGGEQCFSGKGRRSIVASCRMDGLRQEENFSHVRGKRGYRTRVSIGGNKLFIILLNIKMTERSKRGLQWGTPTKRNYPS